MATEVADLVIKVHREGVTQATAELEGLGHAADESGDEAFTASVSWDALQHLIDQAGQAAAKSAIDYLTAGKAMDYAKDQADQLSRSLEEQSLIRGGGIFGGPPGKGFATDMGSAFRGASNAAQGLLGFLTLISPTINLIIAGLVGVVSLLGSALVAGTALATAMGAVAVGMGLAALKWRDLFDTTSDGVDHMRASLGAIEAELFNGAKRVMAVFSQGVGGNPWEQFARLTIEAIRLVEPYIIKVADWVKGFLDTLKGSHSATSPWMDFLRTWIDEWKVLIDIVNQGIEGGNGLIGFLQKYEAPAKAFVEGIANVINGIRKMSAAGLGLNMDQLAEFITNVFNALANLVQYFPRFSNALVSVGLQITRFINDMLPVIDAAIQVGTALLQHIVAPLVNGVLKALDLVMKVPFLRWLVELGGGFALAAFGITKLTFGLFSFMAVIKSPVTLIRFIQTVKQMGGPLQALTTYFPRIVAGLQFMWGAAGVAGDALTGGALAAGTFSASLVGLLATAVIPLAAGIGALTFVLGSWHKTQDAIKSSNQQFIDGMANGTMTIEQATAAIAKNTIAIQDNQSVASQAGQDISGLWHGAMSSILKMAEIPAEIAAPATGGTQIAQMLDQQAEAQQRAEAWAQAIEQVNGSLQEQADNINHSIQQTGAMTDAQVQYALRLKASETGQAAFNTILGTADTQYNNGAISVGQYAKILDQLGVSVNSVGTHVDLMRLKVQAAGNTIAQSIKQVRDQASIQSKSLQSFALVTGQSWSDMQKAVDEAINDPTGGILGTGQKMTEFLQEQMDTINKWKETYATSINFVNAAWETLGSTANLTSTKIVAALDKAVHQAAEMKANITKVVKAGLSPAAMAQITAQPVSAQASIFSALSTATHKQIQQINRDVRHGASLAEATANIVGDSIGMSFDKVITAIELLISDKLGLSFKQVQARVDRMVGDVNRKTGHIKDRDVKVKISLAEQASVKAGAQSVSSARSVAESFLPSQSAMNAAGKQVGQAAASGVSQGVSSGKAQIVQAANAAGDQGVNALKKSASPQKFQQIGKDAVNGVADGVKGAQGSLVSQMQSVGAAMGEGLRVGLLNALDQAAADALARVAAMPRDVKKALGITSPSKVFRRIGNDIANGLRLGFKESMRGMNTDVATAQRNLQKGWGYSGGRRSQRINGRLQFDWRRGQADLAGAMAWEARNAL